MGGVPDFPLYLVALKIRMFSGAARTRKGPRPFDLVC